jgi:hypothetical protein
MKPLSLLRNILSVLAGFITVFALSVGTDLVMESTGVLPPATQPEAYVPWMLGLALAYRTIITVFGGWITAKLAPAPKRKHVMALGIIGTIGGIVGIFAGWQYGNHWYPIALAVLAYPSVWFGGKLGGMQKRT